MSKRKYLIFPFLVLMACMLGTLKAAESDDDSLANDRITTDNITPEQEESSEETRDVNSAKAQGKATTIKMIVGGESSDGVAKQVILPIKE